GQHRRPLAYGTICIKVFGDPTTIEFTWRIFCMKRLGTLSLYVFIAAVALTVLSVSPFGRLVNAGHTDTDVKPTYPEARKVDTVDDYFGTKVSDPYRWLEDDNSPE